ncbi:uncharacterized protein CHSO_3018 [Chryseobacterium sp. StRB126]|uniref:hypothetical protein n=1 Tax=Chryseobacterium sp. StRB126 TaxID=878220 RepID=UPI0004E996CC|nr:hypothetical protein [Chryseobacterium sp. StRB126]BAP32055.1 uncharacterized protein CHSO_3018 [Chryseobacterium sp. StRB126]
MRILYCTIFISLFSCSKSVEDHCFINPKDKINNEYKEEKPYSVEQILKHQPDYLEIVNLTKYRNFKKDSIESNQFLMSDEELEKKWKAHEEEFKIFKEKFQDEFGFSGRQEVGNTTYALGRNNLGYWLLKIQDNKPSAYFLGLSFSHYYINKIQEQPMIKDGFLQLEGSLVKFVEVGGLPVYHDYSAIEDGKLFKINLKDLFKDSDKDGYNDIFEKSFGLNENSRDTDGDGIEDFNDLNPMFRSENNKFAQLYEMLLPQYSGIENFKTLHYSFEVFISDCDYFHQINPSLRVLFLPENKEKQTYYTRVTDVIDHGVSKLKQESKKPDKYYIDTWGSSSSTEYSAEFKDGKWIMEVIMSTVV